MSNSSSAFFFYDRKLTWMVQRLWWGEGRAETGSSGQPLSNFPQSRRLCSWTKVPLWAKPHHDTEQMYLHPAEERRRERNLIPKSDMNINHLLTLVRDWWVWLRKSLSHSTTLARKKQFGLWAAWSVDGSLEGWQQILTLTAARGNLFASTQGLTHQPCGVCTAEGWT